MYCGGEYLDLRGAEVDTEELRVCRPILRQMGKVVDSIGEDQTH
jgi:hypothetical protein